MKLFIYIRIKNEYTKNGDIRIKNEYTKNRDSEIKIWTIYYG